MDAALPPAHLATLGLEPWQVTRGRLELVLACGTISAAGALAAAVAGVCERHGRVVDIDVRGPSHLHLATVGSTEADVALARAILDLAGERDAVADPRPAPLVEIAVDALDIGAVLPFWRAVLAYVDDEPGPGGVIDAIADPYRLGPSVWFQQMDAPRPQRNRIHLDVIVPADQAQERISAALEAGGTMVSEAHARSFWVLADAEGNEACVCTWQDRD